MTDKLGSYRVAQRDVMPCVTHDTTQYANNRAEVSISLRAQQERQMRGFTSPAHAQRFLHVNRREILTPDRRLILTPLTHGV